MGALFVFGTLGFWLLSVIAFIIIILALENKRWGGTGATLTMIGFFAALWFFGGQTLREASDFITQHPIKCTLNILGYIVVGIVWSFVKWYYFLLNYKEKVDRTYQNWRNYIPKVVDNKGKIIAWMTYWPMSALWTIINDPVRRMYDKIYRKLGKVYQKISDNVFKD